MTLAHDLFERIGMDIEKGATTRYPASAQPEGKPYRVWATHTGGSIQFGIQLRTPTSSFTPLMVQRLTTFGFKPRPNGREHYVKLPDDLDEAELLAHALIQLVLRLYLGLVHKEKKLIAESE